MKTVKPFGGSTWLAPSMTLLGRLVRRTRAGENSDMIHKGYYGSPDCPPLLNSLAFLV